MFVESLEGNRSFSEGGIEQFIREARVNDLVHVLSHSENKDHCDRAAKKILERYCPRTTIVTMHNVSIYDLVHICDCKYVSEDYVSRANELIRTNI